MGNPTYTYLIMVDTKTNHNKYYKMIPAIPDETHFTVEYGRVGAASMKKVYGMSAWDTIYNGKINAGYVDQSNLYECSIEKQDNSLKQYEPIKDLSVSALVETLHKYAKLAVKAAYRISFKEVSSEMVASANKKLAELYATDDLTNFNDLLCELFAIIPRKMKQVDEYIAKNTDDIPAILSREEDILASMSGLVTQEKRHSIASKKLSILEENHLSITPCTEEEIDQIKRHLGKESLSHFKTAYRVKNSMTEQAFNNYCNSHDITKQNIHYLYHGSRNSNWWNILIEGLSITPVKNVIRIGAMFGHGLYFAPRAKKSINYTSLDGIYSKEHDTTAFLAVYKVAYKKPHIVYSWRSNYRSFTEKTIHALGADAVLGSKEHGMLVNDELVIYNSSQCTIHYLIELKK